jgi:hypothetical protein
MDMHGIVPKPDPSGVSEGAEMLPTLVLGVDFSSAPSRRKPVKVAVGRRVGQGVMLVDVLSFARLPDLAAWLAAQPRWIGGFDLPFGLPRAWVEAQGVPGLATDWGRLMQWYADQPRAELRERFKQFCDTRPVGRKFAHRACDVPAGASPSMKWVNPPVAWMMHAGVPLLRAIGACFPGLSDEGDPGRQALEAYPGWLAREVLGRQSYKADDIRRQTPDRRAAREVLCDALIHGRTSLQVRLLLTDGQRAQLIDDAQGDAVDAVLCLIQVAWAAQQPRWGWPERVDSLEGWILGVPAPVAASAMPSVISE